MGIDVDEIFEKKVLVPEPKHGKWKPDMSMLMHVACFDDEGAWPGDIADKKKEALENGDGPLRYAKLKVMVSVEYLDA